MRALLVLCAVLGLAGCKRQLAEELEPGLWRLLLPRQVDNKRKVELFWVEPGRQVPKPWPVVLYLHGVQEAEKSGGLRVHEWGALRKTAALGYLAAGVSLPGYGGSTGPRDFCGQDSQHAVHDVIRHLRRRPEISENRIVLVGASRGATVAGKVGEQVAGIAGLVLISGFYDLGEAYYRWKADKDSPENQALATAFKEEIVVSEAGPVELMLRERSVLPEPILQSPTLVLQGGKDPVTDPLKAGELVRKLKSKGVDAQLVLYHEAGHQMPLEAREREIEPFFKKVLGR